MSFGIAQDLELSVDERVLSSNIMAASAEIDFPFPFVPAARNSSQIFLSITDSRSNRLLPDWVKALLSLNSATV